MQVAFWMNAGVYKYFLEGDLVQTSGIPVAGSIQVILRPEEVEVISRLHSLAVRLLEPVKR